jgi:hypothetical protein
MLRGEEWNALMNMVKARVTVPDPALGYQEYERLSQIAWFSHKYFPTLPTLQPSKFLSSFALDNVSSADTILDS